MKQNNSHTLSIKGHFVCETIHLSVLFFSFLSFFFVLGEIEIEWYFITVKKKLTMQNRSAKANRKIRRRIGKRIRKQIKN